MSDWLQFAVDERVGAKDAIKRAAQLRKNLVAAGWIVASAGEKRVLGTKGHRPGPQVRSWYMHANDESDFTTLMTNGVAIETGPFTDSALRCEACGQGAHLRSLRSSDNGGPPVVCGNLTLTFHNWPPLDHPGWKKSIIDKIAETLGARPAIAWTKL
jgi:hypothetical protein